jgi:hypothetical protein
MQGALTSTHKIPELEQTKRLNPLRLKKKKMKQNSQIPNLQISARIVAIVTNMLRGFPQSLQENFDLLCRL